MDLFSPIVISTPDDCTPIKAHNEFISHGNLICAESFLAKAENYYNTGDDLHFIPC